jgi:hypothetical protein
MSTVSELFKNLSSPEMLAKIAKEIKDTTKEVKVKRKGVIHTETRRGKSEIVLNAIHEFMGDEHLEGCANAEFPCLFALVKVFLDEKNGGAIIDGLAKILPILYSKPNVLAAHFSQINVYIQKNFVDSKVAIHSQEKLHLSKEAAILRQTDYAAKVYKQHGEQKQLVDSEILEKINELRTHEDWQSLLVCIGLAIGSRLIEIITVSNYLPAENPIYCIIERRRRREGTCQQKTFNQTYYWWNSVSGIKSAGSKSSGTITCAIQHGPKRISRRTKTDKTTNYKFGEQTSK